MYADNTTLNYTLDNWHSTTTDELKSSIINELQKIFKWLDVDRLYLNLAKSKFMLCCQKITPNLTFDLNGVYIHVEKVNESNFLRLSIDCNLNWKTHLHMVSILCMHDIESTWISKKTKIYISIIHSTYYIQFSYSASHQLFIAGMGNEMSETRTAAKESS